MEGNTLNSGPSDEVIRFNCSFCGQHIRVPKSVAGTKSRCPKCKNVIIIPQSIPPPQADEPSRLKDEHDLLFQRNTQNENTPEDKPKDQQFEGLRQSAGLDSLRPSPEPKRKFPWLIDILLYPASTPSLISIGIIVILPFLVNIIAWLLGPFGFFILIPGFFFIKIPIVLFLFWYFSECISDSAGGGVRAPETINTFSEWGQIFRLVFTWLVFWLPPILYSTIKYPPIKMLAAVFSLPEGESAKDVLVYIIQNDIIFCLLWFYAIYFFPMGLLSVILSDSLTGLNYLLIIRSIFRTFFKYFLVVVVFHIPTMVLFGMLGLFPNLVIGLLGLPFRFAWVWLLLIVGHLTGRYYYRNEEKLYWDV